MAAGVRGAAAHATATTRPAPDGPAGSTLHPSATLDTTPFVSTRRPLFQPATYFPDDPAAAQGGHVRVQVGRVDRRQQGHARGGRQRRRQAPILLPTLPAIGGSHRVCAVRGALHGASDERRPAGAMVAAVGRRRRGPHGWGSPTITTTKPSSTCPKLRPPCECFIQLVFILTNVVISTYLERF